MLMPRGQSNATTPTRACLAGMYHALVFLASLVAGVCASKTTGLSKQAVQGYIDKLVEGLPEHAITRVKGKLDLLEAEDVKVLYDVCCKNGECVVGTAAFLVDQCSAFTKEEKIVKCAWYLPERFMEYIKSLEDSEHPKETPVDIPDALKYPAVTPSDAAFIKGLGLWYLDTGCKADIKESPKEALSYVFLSDESPVNNEAMMVALLGTTSKPESKVLHEYWEKQPSSRQLAVYRNLRTGGYGDLAVLQPVIFDMECIQSRTCSDKDYDAAFKAHVIPKSSKRRVPDTLVGIFRELHISQTADILRKLTGKRLINADEALKIMAREFVLRSKPLKELGKLVYQATNPESYVPESYPDYLILGASRTETLEVLNRQVFDLVTYPESLLEAAPFFSHTRVAKYITKRYRTIKRYGELYWEAIRDILGKVLRVGHHDWFTTNPSPTNDLTEDDFWQLVAFLEEEYQQYRGLFGQSILAQKKVPEEFRKLVPGGLKALIQDVAEPSGKAELHGKLDTIALGLFKLLLPDHPLFRDQFEALRQQLTEGLFKAFGTQPFTAMCLGEHILSANVGARELDELHDLQVEVVIQYFITCRADPAKDEEAWMEILAEYDSRQLANIYVLDSTVLPILKHPKLRERFNFDSPVTYNQTFQELSKLYQLAFPHRESAIKRILEYLSGDLTTESYMLYVSPLVDVLLESPEGLDLSMGGENSPWAILDQNWYAKVDSNDSLDLMYRLYPELADIPSPGGAAASRCKTFDELLDIITLNNDTK